MFRDMLIVVQKQQLQQRDMSLLLNAMSERSWIYMHYVDNYDNADDERWKFK